MNNTIIFGIGFTAQFLFSARLIVQWIKSEAAGKVLSPVIFWYLSLAGSFLLIFYGILREDIVIVGAQLLLYYIYIRNLMLKKVWYGFLILIKIAILSFPFGALLWISVSTDINVSKLLQHKQISMPLLYWGGIGQIIFSFRFIFQWIYSEKIKESVLPLFFWVISLTGSSMILVYAMFRHDPVIFIGHIFGVFIYIRNIIIYKKQGMAFE